MTINSKSHCSTLNSMGYRHQKGGSLIGLLFNCGLILFAAFIAMKLVPVYSAESAIQAKLESSLESFSQVSQVNKKTLAASMTKRLNIDGIETAGLYDEMVIEKVSSKSINVKIPYQKIVPLFGDISFLFKFEAAATK